MADERLGASFSIDTTNLKAGLTQANRLIRESESQFKAAAAGMDDWSKSEDGLNAKIKSLSNITEIQKKKVSALKSEYQNLINNGLDPTSKEAVDLRIKINNEEAALKRNEKELQKQKDALKNVGEESEEAGRSYEKLGDIAKKAGQVAAVAFTAAAAAVGALVKSSMESYAQYEQLVGGVDTLFKNSSSKVQEYANNAYKTAGMSANEYMETVTGFSASLLQSLGGDTEKAADYADMAIRDMSDNANKMGTDIESIQNAYGGFAKQNYTMLDNLKLGYGGTKEEMQRLLKDAEKVSGIKYDLSSYSDIVDAIHVVQTEMGITGTTAKEASTTIQGSLSSMKGAWANLLTGLADENADLDGLITNLIDSVGTVAENIIPRIKVILTGIVKLVAGLVPQIPPLLQQMLPELIDAIMSLIDGVIAVLPDIIQAVVDVIPQIIKAIVEMIPTLVTALYTIIADIIVALAQMLPEIVQAIVDIIPQIISAVKEAFPLLLDAVIQLVMSLVDCIPMLIDALITALPEIIETLVGFLETSIPQLMDAAITLFMAILDAIPELIGGLLQNLPKIIKTIVDTLLNNLPKIIDGAITLFFGILDAIPQICSELLKNLPEIIVTIVGCLIEAIPELIDAGGQLLGGLFEGMLDPERIWNAVKELFNGIVGGLKKLFGIKSPSRVMANVVGKNLALGIGVGFEKNIGAVNKEISEAMNFDDANINVNARNNGAKSNGTSAGAGSVVVYQTNNYSQAHSRLELYKSKQQTAAAVRLAMVGV